MVTLIYVLIVYDYSSTSISIMGAVCVHECVGAHTLTQASTLQSTHVSITQSKTYE